MKANYHPSNFGGHSHSDSGVMMILVSHVMSQEHVIKGSSDFIGWRPSW